MSAEEGGVAVDGVAVGGVEDVADDRLRDLRREDDGGLLGLDLARAEASSVRRAASLADLFGDFELLCGAGVRVPVVALHAALFVLGDGLRRRSRSSCGGTRRRSRGEFIMILCEVAVSKSPPPEFWMRVSKAMAAASAASGDLDALGGRHAR